MELESEIISTWIKRNPSITEKQNKQVFLEDV